MAIFKIDNHQVLIFSVELKFHPAKLINVAVS